MVRAGRGGSVSQRARQRRERDAHASARKLAAFAQDLAIEIAHTLRTELGVSRERADELATQTSMRACAHHRGEWIYIPANYAHQVAERDQRLYQFYLDSGRNEVATAHHFDVTVKTVYERVRMVEQARFAKNQAKLFPESDAEE